MVLLQVGVTEIGLVFMSAIYAAIRLGHRITRVPIGCLRRGLFPKSNCCKAARHRHPGPLNIRDVHIAVKELLKDEVDLTPHETHEVRIICCIQLCF